MLKNIRFRTAIVLLPVSLLFGGCAAYPLLMVAGTEVAGSYAVGDFKVTGEFIKRNADWSKSFKRHVDMKIALNHADWLCAHGRVDSEYDGAVVCLPPDQATMTNLKDSVTFSCRSGRGGSITAIVTRDRDYYCEVDKSNS